MQCTIVLDGLWVGPCMERSTFIEFGEMGGKDGWAVLNDGEDPLEGLQLARWHYPDQEAMPRMLTWQLVAICGVEDYVMMAG